jgi:hypothetical protein
VCAAGDLLRKRCLPGSRLPARWIEFAWPRRALQLLQSAIQIPLIIMPGTTQAGANRIVVFQSGRRDTWPYAPSRKWRERETLASVRATRRTEQGLFYSLGHQCHVGAHAAERGETARSTDTKKKKGKAEAKPTQEGGKGASERRRMSRCRPSNHCRSLRYRQAMIITHSSSEPIRNQPNTVALDAPCPHQAVLDSTTCASGWGAMRRS